MRCGASIEVVVHPFDRWIPEKIPRFCLTVSVRIASSALCVPKAVLSGMLNKKHRYYSLTTAGSLCMVKKCRMS
jgi:hypothetical protein